MSARAPAAEAEDCRRQNARVQQALAELEQAREQIREAEARVKRLLLACGYVVEERGQK
jgi:hypothetical protein